MPAPPETLEVTGRALHWDHRWKPGRPPKERRRAYMRYVGQGHEAESTVLLVPNIRAGLSTKLCLPISGTLMYDNYHMEGLRCGVFGVWESKPSGLGVWEFGV